VNSEVRDTELVNLVAERLLPIKSSTTIERGDLSALFEASIQVLSFIGCVVIDRDLWMRRDKATYFGTEFVHVGVIFQSPLPGRVLLIANPYVIIRFGNAQWKSRAFEIWMVKWPHLLASFSSVSPVLTRPYAKPPFLAWMKSLILHRSRGEYSMQQYRRWIADRSELPRRAAALVLALVPQPLANSLVRAYLSRFNKEGHRWLGTG
jgi:abequosyltransferase